MGDDSWYLGAVGDKTGMFPKSFVEVVIGLPHNESLEVDNGIDVDKRNEDTKLAKVIAIHDYSSSLKEDLNFKRGDIIIVFKRIDVDWYYGKLNEETGVFPCCYVLNI